MRLSKKIPSGLVLLALTSAAAAFYAPASAQGWQPLRANTRSALSHPARVSPPSSFCPAQKPRGFKSPTPGSRLEANSQWVNLGRGARMRLAPQKKDEPNTLSSEVLETIRLLKESPINDRFQMPSPITKAVSNTLTAPDDYNENQSNKEAANEQNGAIKPKEAYLRFGPKKNIRIAELDFRDTPVADALRSLSQLIGVNLMLQQGISGNVTVLFSDITIEEAFNTLMSAYSLSFAWEGSILRIFPRSSAPTTTRIFPVQHTNAIDIKPIIDRILTSGRACEVDTRTNSLMITDTEEKLAEVASLLPQVDIEETAVDISARPVTEVYYLDYADASALEEPIKMLSSAVQIKVFSSNQASQAAAAGGSGGSGRNDMMILTDTQRNLDRITELIEKLDVPPIQVTIDAHIYEIDKNKEKQAGVNWQKAIPMANSADNLINLTIAPMQADMGGTGVLSYGSLDVQQFKALLAALESYSFAKVLSNPVITTLNNHKATITVGQSIPYVSASTVNTETGVVQNTVETAEANITLDVTPSVTGNDEVFLDIRPDISSVLGFTSLGGNQTPNLSTRNAETQVICKNNNTIVIGGMIKTDKSTAISKVPFFGSLPGIGKFFQSKNEKESRSELIIFITPHIVYQDANRRAKKISEQNRPRLTLQTE